MALDKQYLLIWGYHIDWDIIVLLCGKTGNAINTVYRDLSQFIIELPSSYSLINSQCLF